MNDKVTLLTLGVEDLERSRDFYTNGLGWTPTMEVEHEVTFYQVGHGLLLALFGVKDLATDAAAPVVRGNSFSIASNQESEDDVDELFDRARAAGAKIVKEPQKAFWGGYHGYFADRDGYLWEVAYNAGIKVADDGTVVFEQV